MRTSPTGRRRHFSHIGSSYAIGFFGGRSAEVIDERTFQSSRSATSSKSSSKRSAYTSRVTLAFSCPRARWSAYLKSHAAQELADGADPLVVTQNGVARLVVMDAADYERREQTLALLKLVAFGDREIERGRHWEADEVYAELDAD